ncbi:MAG: ThuA domain-containing protein, partial [Isosphaeraceae bacterium]
MFRALLTAVALVGVASPVAIAADAAKIVLVAGKPSHGPGDHEFNAGIKLLAKCLSQVEGVEPVIVTGGWPEDVKVFDGARALVFFMDGGGNHPMIQGDRLQILQALMDQGVGLVCMHYAVEVPKGKPGDRFLDWIGGYYETGFSTNPHWTAQVARLPEHPITRGVRPFAVKDEWYYNIRFRPEMKGITP